MRERRHVRGPGGGLRVPVCAGLHRHLLSDKYDTHSVTERSAPHLLNDAVRAIWNTHLVNFLNTIPKLIKEDTIVLQGYLVPYARL